MNINLTQLAGDLSAAVDSLRVQSLEEQSQSQSALTDYCALDMQRNVTNGKRLLQLASCLQRTGRHRTDSFAAEDR